MREVPHAREFLEFCRRHGLRTFLLSSVHRDHFAAQAAATGSGRYMDHSYVEMWAKRAKIHQLLGDHGLAPRQPVFIGALEPDV